jgi:hypothetical protein
MYVEKTRFKVVRHEYTPIEYPNTNQGYVEVIEIRNPPKNKRGIILHCYRGDEGSTYCEYRTVRDAALGFAIVAGDASGGRELNERLRKTGGFIRRVKCNPIAIPWFYDVRGKCA